MIDAGALVSPTPQASLKDLRVGRRISQRAMAKSLGIPRTHLQRLERKSWGKLSLADLELVARGLETPPEKLLGEMRGAPEHADVLARISFKEPLYTIQYPEAVNLGCHFLAGAGKCFVGTLTILPKATLSEERVPAGDFLLYQVMEGEMLVTARDREHYFRAHECFVIRGEHPYEIHNPHAFHKLVAVLFAATPPRLAVQNGGVR